MPYRQAHFCSSLDAFFAAHHPPSLHPLAPVLPTLTPPNPLKLILLLRRLILSDFAASSPPQAPPFATLPLPPTNLLLPFSLLPLRTLLLHLSLDQPVPPPTGGTSPLNLFFHPPLSSPLPLFVCHPPSAPPLSSLTRSCPQPPPRFWLFFSKRKAPAAAVASAAKWVWGLGFWFESCILKLLLLL